MSSSSISKKKDINTDTINRKFSFLYPEHFKGIYAKKYVSGDIARVLEGTKAEDLSAEDKEALDKFLPEYIAKESTGTVKLLKAAAEISSLRELVREMSKALDMGHSESWWQTYIHNKILIIQQGYIKAIEKMNIAIGTMKFPDYTLVTHDGYLDIIEIKKPDTNVIKYDTGRGNYYWDSEITKAIIQVENYIENISKHADPVRSYLKDKYEIELKVVRPRGIIIAGDVRKFDKQKERDDFRVLSQSSKNITFLTYDELVTRLENYTKVLENYSK